MGDYGPQGFELGNGTVVGPIVVGALEKRETLSLSRSVVADGWVGGGSTARK